MTVQRVVPNIEAADPHAARAFYGDVLGMAIVMDHGWILTFGGGNSAMAQVSIAVEGGSGTPVPDLSVEVDDFGAVFGRATASGTPIEYGPATEPWGVRRFYARDPFGRLVNVLCHV